jgi:hypothetical protein
MVFTPTVISVFDIGLPKTICPPTGWVPLTHPVFFAKITYFSMVWNVAALD